MDKMYPKMSTERAQSILSKFNTNAYEVKLFNNHQCALETLYGEGFDVVYNLNKRMEFFCYICRKLMNSVASLEQHAISGQHLKNKSECEKMHEEENNVITESSFSEAIKYTRVPILGLQYIEVYEDSDNYYCSVYYKCNLCGDHGDKCYIYFHLIGNHHTDKYISMKIKLDKTQSLNSQRRLYLRKEIWRTETFGPHNIVTFVGRTLYPYLWKAEKSGSRKKHSSRHLSDGNDGKINNYKIRSENHKVMESGRSEGFCSYSFFQQNILPFIIKVTYVDMQQQNMDNYIYHRSMLKIAAYIDHILYLVTNGLIDEKRKRDEDTKDLLKQKKRIKKSLDALNDHLLPDVRRRFKKENSRARTVY